MLIKLQQVVEPGKYLKDIKEYDVYQSIYNKVINQISIQISKFFPAMSFFSILKAMLLTGCELNKVTWC